MSNPHQGAAILDDLSARGLIQDTTDVAALRASLRRAASDASRRRRGRDVDISS